MNQIIELLHKENYSCVIKNGDEIRFFTQPGIVDLYNLVKNEPSFLKGSLVADKIIGKAASSLMILGDVKEIYTDTISQSAINLLEGTEIKLTYTDIVPFIKNRTQDGLCIMEQLTQEEDSVDKILILIEQFINEMKNKKK